MMQERARVWLALVASAILAGCSVPPTDEESRDLLQRLEPQVESASVERTPHGELVLRWPSSSTGATTIYAGATPETIDRSHPVATSTSNTVTFADPTPGRRSYFEVVPKGEPPRLIAERRLPLEGTDNFRDLGGYRTSDGRRVRWGRIYRSGELSRLTDRDLAYVSSLGLRLVCDFRSPKEREARPDRLPESDALQVINPAIWNPAADPHEISRRIRSGDLSDLPTSNVEATREYAPQYGQMFERILSPGGLPALFHCTAGKDRTGFAAALILLALGVPEDAVRYDYLLSNRYRAQRLERTLQFIRFRSLFRADLTRIRAMMEVRPELLDAKLEAIDRDHGSVAAYLRDALGLTDQQLARLQALLLG